MATGNIQILMGRLSRMNLSKSSLCRDFLYSNTNACLDVVPNMSKKMFIPCVISSSYIHTGSVQEAWFKATGPKKWLTYNDKVYPPQDPSEERRPAFVCHSRANIKYSTKNMWYVACLVRGMTIDEAIKQLSFVSKKGAKPALETLLEAQEIAVKDHNVEFKSNLWIAESFVGKGQAIKGMRRHARKRPGVVQYKHCHYFVRLEEGKPPTHYYTPPKSGEDMLENWMMEMRRRKITHSL